MAVALAMAAPVLPGVVVVEHSPAHGWTVALAAMNGEIHCAQTLGGAIDCIDRPFFGGGKAMEGARRIEGLGVAVTAFVRSLGVPESRYAKLEVVQPPRTRAFWFLRQAEGHESSRRFIGNWGVSGWTATEALPPVREGMGEDSELWEEWVEASAAPVALPGGDLLIVLGSEFGDYGNNASGAVSFRGVTIISSDDPVLPIKQSIDLGAGTWGRAVTGIGLLMGSRSNFLCPSPWVAGVELIEVCPNSIDPRGFGVFAEWCREPCKHGRMFRDRVGKYLVREGVLRKARARSLRRAQRGDLIVTEVPEPMSASSFLDYIELKNRSRDAVMLTDLEIATTDEGGFESSVGVVREEPECIADAGDLIILADPDWLAEVGPKPGVVCLVDTIGSLDLDRSLAIRSPSPKGPETARTTLWFRRRLPPAPERDWVQDVEVPRRAWQVDAQGRECWREASPGQENLPCR